MRSLRLFSCGLTVLGLLTGAPGRASAEVKQPDGTVIPVSTRLKDALATQGETIDPLTQAAVTPETFDPACSLEFHVVARGGGQKNSFGWYNVTGKKPALSDLHEFIGCDDAVGATKTLAIRNDPAYLGGRIAFFEATTQGKPGNCVKFGPTGPDPATLGYVFYSEKAYNEDNNYHLLILDSGKFKNSFYFGWEDLNEGNDNDFEDLLTRVDGIQCAGGGEACDTGQKGICGVGILQCKAGKLTCVPQQASRAEVCNGLDDDCNGAVDDAPECSCTKGEFACATGKVCTNGTCVDAECAGKTCKEGEVCSGGTCKAPCAGVICPAGLVCRLEACVDACAGVECDADQVCDLGVCKTKCQCGVCEAGKTCAESGKCVDSGCETQTCSGATTCKAGACVDSCEGAVCPLGSTCAGGQCVAVPGAGGAGGAAGSGIELGGSGGNAGAGAASSGGAAGTNAGSAGSAGKKGKSSFATADDPDSGCGCRVAGLGHDGTVGLGLSGLLALALSVRSFRRRRAEPCRGDDRDVR